jgi:Phage tail assembly chaperone protein, TAC
MMEKRTTFKDIELNGKKYRINKFDALTGSFISYMLMQQLLPSLLKSDGVKPEDVIGGALFKMDKESFTRIQKDCLSVCHEIHVHGKVDVPVAVILQSGEWGVKDLEHDTVTVMALTIHALIFNLQSFFVEGSMNGLMESFKGLGLSLSVPKA